jgi:hypothetical protein
VNPAAKPSNTVLSFLFLLPERFDTFAQRKLACQESVLVLHDVGETSIRSPHTSWLNLDPQTSVLAMGHATYRAGDDDMLIIAMARDHV